MRNVLSTSFSSFVFDMDGLLIDTERLGMKAWQQAFEERDFHFDEALYLQTIGRTRKESGEVYLSALGRDFPYDELRQLRKEIVIAWVEQDGVPLKPGSTELLEYCRSKGIRCALASSSHRDDIEMLLSRAGLLNYFEVICAGNEVDNGKPAPDIFLLAAERLGDMTSNCIVIEDSPYGVQAACGAGMRAVAIPDLLPHEEEGRENVLVLPSLEELLTQLQALGDR